jgi:hypothetical protein
VPDVHTIDLNYEQNLSVQFSLASRGGWQMGIVAGLFHPACKRLKTMTTPIKALFAALATGAMAVSAAAPALAHDGFGHGGGFGDGWNRDNPRHAIEACSRVAEREASRNSYGRVRVTDVRDVRDTRWGYEVRGRIALGGGDHGWNDRGRNDRGFGHGWRDDDRRNDSGSFTCRIERGRVAYLDFDGIRGL